MNKYGRQAMEFWRTWRPSAYQKIPDPQTYFTNLGEEIEDRAVQVQEALISQLPAQNNYQVRLGQMNMAKMAAEEAAMKELVYLPSDSAEEEEEPSEDPAAAMIGPDGMPTDRNHPLWAAMTNPDITDQQWDQMVSEFLRSLEARAPQA